MRNLFAGLIAVVLGLNVFAAHAAPPAEFFVQQSIEKGLAILNDRSLPAEQRSEGFRTLLLTIVDVRRVALFTLGPYARTASAPQLEAFEKTQ